MYNGREKSAAADVFDVGDEAVEDEEEDFEAVGSGAVKDGDKVRAKSCPTDADPWFWILIVGAVVGLALGVVIGEKYFPDKTWFMKSRNSYPGIDTRIPFSVLLGLFGAFVGVGVVGWIEDKRAGNWEGLFKKDEDAVSEAADPPPLKEIQRTPPKVVKDGVVVQATCGNCRKKMICETYERDASCCEEHIFNRGTGVNGGFPHRERSQKYRKARP